MRPNCYLYSRNPWDVSNCNNFLEPPKLHYQSFSYITVFSLILGLLKKIQVLPNEPQCTLVVSYFNNCLETPNFHYQTFHSKTNLTPVNKLMITSVTTKPSPLPRTSTRLGGGGSIYQVCIRPTEKLQSQPGTIFRINEQ